MVKYIHLFFTNIVTFAVLLIEKCKLFFLFIILFNYLFDYFLQFILLELSLFNIYFLELHCLTNLCSGELPFYPVVIIFNHRVEYATFYEIAFFSSSFFGRFLCVNLN